MEQRTNLNRFLTGVILTAAIWVAIFIPFTLKSFSEKPESPFLFLWSHTRMDFLPDYLSFPSFLELHIFTWVLAIGVVFTKILQRTAKKGAEIVEGAATVYWKPSHERKHKTYALVFLAEAFFVSGLIVFLLFPKLTFIQSMLAPVIFAVLVAGLYILSESM
ncbi:hypothetical protein [Acanthopleuribacter pedis]|uniref:Uncharacterized protein n=1 Tax=Acanthopleuribacter pedis TaxID=442870 RepID=A0A8J7U1E9_9BACT|nr:hypothetical protein [Acanthopleuribacter pedis]MBO1318108.1 hypothetical protein [Acanthopleuribacter pedis]